MKDLFGNEIKKDVLLRDKFIEPPFSVLDTKSGNWMKRKRQWKRLGIKSEVGRVADQAVGGMLASMNKYDNEKGKSASRTETNTSVFDPALCEVLYHWFVPDGGDILDPFAGGSVRGIVANYLGYKYTGIDIRQEQVESNIEQGLEILANDNQPKWIIGDSNKVLDSMWNLYDFVFSCPPYADLEVYSDLEGDISNMGYDEFLEIYQSIITKSCKLLKSGGYACFVVGEVRDKVGNYLGFVPDTYKCFKNAGVEYYNEAILLNQLGTACMRANNTMKNQKLVKVHQNILIFKKP